MHSPIDSVISQTIPDHLENFIRSFQGDSKSLTSFLGGLSTIHSTICTRRDKLQQDTLVAVQSFASIINSITANMRELELSTKSLVRQSESDLLNILEENQGELAISQTSDYKSLPPYIKPSYEWLLSNLHNPYPSKDFKKAISKNTNTPIKDIDAWFIDVRKRIGWNALRKSHFSNKQEKIITAATQVFRSQILSFSDDLEVSLISEMDKNDLHRPKFIAMEKCLRSLYPGKFPELPSLTNPAVSSFEPPMEEGPRRIGKTLARQSSPISSALQASSYPTPEPSPRPLEEDSLTSTSRSASTDPSPVSISQSSSKKRQRSSSDTSDPFSTGSHSHPQKRLRTHNPEVVLNAAPTAKTSFLPVTEEPLYPELAIPVAESRLKRKRSSESEDIGSPKRSRLRMGNLEQFEDSSCGLLQSYEQDLSEGIPSPAQSRNPIPLGPQQFDLSSCDPTIYLPENHVFPLGDGELEISTSLSPLFNDSLEDFGFMNYAVQFDPLPASCQLDFTCEYPTPSKEIIVFENSELYSTPSGGTPDSHSIADVCSPEGLESAPSAFIRTPFLENLNCIAPRGCSRFDDQEIKRARARVLREELAQLVAEGL